MARIESQSREDAGGHPEGPAGPRRVPRREGSAGPHGAALDKSWKDPRAGESLFELLGHTYNLTAATDHLVRRRDPKGAGEHVAEAVESVSIGVCSNAGCFEFVQEWEGGKTDFETDAGKLAGHLQSKGVSHVGEFKRHLVAARTFGKDFDGSSPKEEQTLGARAAIANGLWVTLASTSIRKAVGSPPMCAYGDFAAVFNKYATRPWKPPRPYSPPNVLLQDDVRYCFRCC